MFCKIKYCLLSTVTKTPKITKSNGIFFVLIMKDTVELSFRQRTDNLICHLDPSLPKDVIYMYIYGYGMDLQNTSQIGPNIK